MTCPIHLSREMVRHQERAPIWAFTYLSKDSNQEYFLQRHTKRVVYRCPVANCPMCDVEVREREDA